MAEGTLPMFYQVHPGLQILGENEDAIMREVFTESTAVLLIVRKCHGQKYSLANTAALDLQHVDKIQ